MNPVYRAALWAASRPTVHAIGELGTERLLINFACAVIGLGGLIEPPAPPSPLADWPGWFAFEWAAAMLLGGVAALAGIIGGYRATTARARERARLAEWVGYVSIGVGGLVVGVTLLAAGGSAARSGVLFLAIAAAKALRLLLSYVSREELLRSAARDGSHGDGS